MKIIVDVPKKVFRFLAMQATALTESEVSQYIRLTLRQYKLENVAVIFCDKIREEYGCYGAYVVGQNKIKLSPIILESFKLFDFILKHEICHKLDEMERGSLFTKNGRINYHGANFNKWCRKLGIPTGRFIPTYLLK